MAYSLGYTNNNITVNGVPYCRGDIRIDAACYSAAGIRLFHIADNKNAPLINSVLPADITNEITGDLFANFAEIDAFLKDNFFNGTATGGTGSPTVTNAVIATSGEIDEIQNDAFKTCTLVYLVVFLGGQTGGSNVAIDPLLQNKATGVLTVTSYGLQIGDTIVIHGIKD